MRSIRSVIANILLLVIFVTFCFIAGTDADDTCTANDETCSKQTDKQPAATRRRLQEGSNSGERSVWKIPSNVLQKSKDSAIKAQLGQGTRIISNLIDDPRILKQLTDHREWFTCYENTRGKRTHWYDKNTPPSTIWEYLAIQIWKDQPILQQDEDFAGFEIWCNILTPEGPLTWHIDKDQVLYEQSGGRELSLPLYGSVWYGYPHEFAGGYLELTEYDTDTWPEATNEPGLDSIERIGAEYNRLVVFNASKFHRVSPIHSGARVTLAVNVWKEKPGVK